MAGTLLLRECLFDLRSISIDGGTPTAPFINV
jgi:hypothetical protein